jgi:hypothetical protein
VGRSIMRRNSSARCGFLLLASRMALGNRHFFPRRWHGIHPGSLALRLHGNQRPKTHRQILLPVNLFSYMLQVIR